MTGAVGYAVTIKRRFGAFGPLLLAVGMVHGATALAEEAADGMVAEQWYSAAIEGCLATMERGETVKEALSGFRLVRADGGLLGSPQGANLGFYVLHLGNVHEVADADGVFRMYCTARSFARPLAEMDHVLTQWSAEAVETGRYGAADKAEGEVFALTSTFRTPRGCRLSVSYGPSRSTEEWAFEVVERAESGCGGAAIDW